MNIESDYKRDLHNLKYNTWFHHKRPIRQYTKDGKFICEFKTITDASKSVGVAVGNIVRCCQGIGKSAGGFKWLYVDTEGKT